MRKISNWVSYPLILIGCVLGVVSLVVLALRGVVKRVLSLLLRILGLIAEFIRRLFG